MALPEPIWTHAFTVGALGLMMLSLMTRVSLRHTGASGTYNKSEVFFGKVYGELVAYSAN